MSRNQYSEVTQNYSVPPYKEPKANFISYIIAGLYLFFVCIPAFLFVYLSVEIFFFIRGINNFIKKTIKNAKTKCQPKPTERLS